MKAAFITDIHFDCRGGSLYFIERYKLFFQNVFFPKLRQDNIKTVIILGDTWENRKHININSLEEARKMFFDVLLENDIQVISILGNHDVFYRNTNEINSMSIIEEAYSNVKVVHEYEEISIGNSSFGLMSWINNENLDRNLKRIKSANTKYLCLHGEIKGFEMTKGVIAESGLDQDLFSGYDEVFSGHFHIKNKIGNIYYIGNPFQTNWDDLGSDRGFHIYDSETDTMNFIKNDYENYDLLYDEDIFNAELYKYQDKIVKVLVPSLSDLDQVKLNSFLDLLQEITYEYTIIETNVKEVDNPEQVKVKSNREMISDYVHQLNIDEDEKTKVLSIMNNLYSTVLINKEYE